MKLKKIFAGVAVATVALSAMAFTVSAEAAEETTLAITEAPAVTDAVATDATTAPATNPTTGNAPIALAAIPVALAAAVIIAKKAK